jgi:threonine/homoserine/homoserine lactone efflux protein
MGEAIGQLLPFAVGVAVSPMPIVAVVLMLVTPQARSNGPAFLLGWIAGVGIGGGVLLVIAGPANANDDGTPADWTYWLKLLLGVALVLLAVRQWRGRPHEGDVVATPKWMGALDDFTPAKAAIAGVALSLANPKNLLLIIGGAAALAQFGLSAGHETVCWIVFTVIASIGVGAPVVIYFALGERAAAILDELKTWMGRNNAAVMAVLCLIIGVKLIGDAITGLSA